MTRYPPGEHIREVMTPEADELDAAIDDHEIVAFLRERKGEVITLSLRELELENHPDELKIIRFEHKQTGLPELPEGYCYIGGAARNTVLAELGDETLPPRDLDVSAIIDLKPDPKLHEQVSSTIMADDYRRGHKAQIETLAEYFTSRDFMLNEVLIAGDKVYATKQALHDLREKIIRPSWSTEQEWREYATGRAGVDPKLAIKALRLQVEFELMYDKGEIRNIGEWQWSLASLRLFDLALGLNKAYQIGDPIATRFYSKLIELGMTDPANEEAYLHAQSIKELALTIQYRMHEERRDPFYFDDEDLTRDDYRDVESLTDKYTQLANTYAGPGHSYIEEY